MNYSMDWDSNGEADYDEPTELDLVYEMLHTAQAERDALIIERNALKAFAEWIATWVNSPAGAFSTDALDGLFGMTRDRLARLATPPLSSEIAPSQTNGK